MDWQRTLLLGAIAAVGILLFNEWGQFQEAKRPVMDTSTTLVQQPAAVPDDSAVSTTGSDLPTAPATSEEQPAVPVAATTAQLIAVTTDTFDVLIDTHGGDIVKVALPEHQSKLDAPDAFVLLNRNADQLYVARSGLIGPNGTDTNTGRPLFSSENSSYVMTADQNQLTVDLYFNQNGVQITKRFIFTRGDNLIQLEYHINNQTDQLWQANLFGQIKRDTHVPQSDVGIGMSPFLGAALTTPDEKYKKFKFSNLEDESFKTTVTGGWVAMVQHYFLSAWVPDQTQENSFTLRKSSNSNIYLMGYTGPRTEVAPGQEGVLKSGFYAGPKDVYRLEELSPYLDLTVDYGWLWWIAKPIFYFLHWIYNFVGSWGWSIILLTVTIKAVFYPLSAASYKSMAKMRKFQPHMVELKERFGDDRQKMSMEMMKLYKKEKINPMGGCLPILIQMPVFISLYWVLMESVELRHTAFMWLDDLSVKDPFFILPIVMGITMFIQQKLNPTPPDPTQAKIMQMMPFVFTFMFMWFPAGLVVYWVVNNTLSIAQQYVITRQIEAADK